MQTFLPPRVDPVAPLSRRAAGRVGAPSLVTWAVVLAGALGSAYLIDRSPIAAVGFVIACGIFLGFLPRPAATGVALAALVPITSGLRRGFPVPGLRVSEALIVVGAVIVLLRVPAGRARPKWTALDWSVAAFTLGGPAIELLDVVTSGRALSGSSLQTVAGPVQFLLLYRVIAVSLTGSGAARNAQRALLLASFPVSLLAIAESLGPAAIHNVLVSWTGTTVFNTNGYTPVPRAASLFPIWLSLAGYLLVPLLLAIALLIAGDTAVLPRWVLITAIVCGFGALVASLTITVFAAAVAGALFLGWRYRRLFRTVAVTCAVGVAAALPFGALLMQRATAQHQSTTQTGNPYVPQTIAYRVQIWQDQYLPALHGHWATGYGPTYPPNITWAHTESGYITLLLRGGIPYLAITAVMLWFVISNASFGALVATTPERRALCEAAMALALLQPLINLTFPYLTDGGLPQPLWVVIGLLAAGNAAPSQALAKSAFDENAVYRREALA